MPIIDAHALVHEYGPVRALDGVDLEVDDGELLVFLGAAGSGKTTLLGVLSTALAPTGGSLTIAGLDPIARRRDIRRLVGMAPADAAFGAELTARENLELLGRLHGFGGRRLRQRVDELLILTGLEGEARLRARALRPGPRQRLNLAAALVHRPRLILLDEPTARCDHDSRHRLFDLISALEEPGTTILVATRRVEVAERLGHRIGILAAGRLVAAGTRDQLAARIGCGSVLRIRTREELRAGAVERLLGDHGYALEPHVVEVGAADSDHAGALLAEVAGRLARGGVHLRGAEVREPDLRTIFARLTGHPLGADHPLGAEPAER
jgi:ABC-2 type transport system ATP-binding protein